MQIGYRDREYGITELILRPQKQMLWGQWQDVTVALHVFTEMFVVTEMKFDVSLDEEKVGTGSLERGLLGS